MATRVSEVKGLAKVNEVRKIIFVPTVPVPNYVYIVTSAIIMCWYLIVRKVTVIVMVCHVAFAGFPIRVLEELSSYMYHWSI